jgi:hypothetical protein
MRVLGLATLKQHFLQCCVFSPLVASLINRLGAVNLRRCCRAFTHPSVLGARAFTMRRRGPTVPRSSAKLGDSEPGEGDAVIASTWRLSLSTDDASTSTDPIRKTDQRRVGTHPRRFQNAPAPARPHPITRDAS